MTSHPKDFSDRIIDVIKSHDNICNSIHLALQSGSNAVLKDMHRMYTREDYMGIVDRIRGSIPDVSITTDIIVGYPNETEEDFEQTLDIVNYCRFESAFTFIYSPREGTRAAKLPQINSKEVINNRFDRLLKLQHSIMDINAAKYEGQTVEVMIDGVSKNNKEMLTGRTKNNMLVHFTGKGNPGDIVDITVTKPTTFYLYGEMI